MKENIINVVKYAINAFYDGKYANFSKSMISRCGVSELGITKSLKQLLEDNIIENKTKNGFYYRFIIKNPIKCPKFIFDESLTIGDKDNLIKCLELGIKENLPIKELQRLLNKKSNSQLYQMNDRMRQQGKTFVEYLTNSEYCDFSKPDDNIIVTPFGWRYKSKPTTHKIPLPEEFLLRKSWNNFQHQIGHIKEYNLTKEYIKEILEKQNYKDYYTGIIPEDYKEYSIDRIDSSKGYIKGNIVITTCRINNMKNNMSVDEFKNKIIQLYNNLDNF